MRSVDAVIVNYNSGFHLQEAVASLLDDGVEKVWIVDNASSDGSSDFAKGLDERVAVVDPHGNLGYGRGVNFGFAMTKSQYVLVCNPDIEVKKGSTQILVDVLSADLDCALVGPRIINNDGSIYPSVRRFPNMVEAAIHAGLGQIMPNNRFSARYRMLNVDHSTTFNADWVSGAVFLTRASAFRRVGGFSPEFFMYLEDVYLCRVFGEHGYRVKYCGQAVVRHAQGATTATRPLRMILAHHVSLWRYSRLTKRGWRKVELVPIAAGILIRLSISLTLAVSRVSLKKPKVELP